MSLRDALRSAVARCTPQHLQPATPGTRSATVQGTRTQPTTRFPGRDGAEPATDNATGAQPPGCTLPLQDAVAMHDSIPAAPASSVLDRLLRWGWPQAEAEATAARIDGREGHDGRRTCVECDRYESSLRRCGDHRAAGLHAAEVGRDLAGLPQRCAGFMQRLDTP